MPYVEVYIPKFVFLVKVLGCFGWTTINFRASERCDLETVSITLKSHDKSSIQRGDIMKWISERANEFLTSYGMGHQAIDIGTYSQLFQEEMRSGLRGEPSSLSMLPTYLEATFKVPRQEKVVVLDAGGTNFRVATVYFDASGQGVIENFRKFPMPGIHQQLGKEGFFRSMAEYTREVLGQSYKIGFCFSYPAEMMPNKDGRVIRFSKEIEAPEVEGELVGENLNAAFRALGLPGDHQIVVLNDTVATLLAGQALDDRLDFSSYVGLILGTGTNLCYIENNSAISKIKDLASDQTQLINMESGGFDKIPQGRLDRIYDQSTNNPGTFIFEKMVSGRYLGGIGKLVLQTAAADGLFSTAMAEKFGALDKMTTIDMNQFLHYPHSISNLLGALFAAVEPVDRSCAYYLLDGLVERAAKLTAVGVSAAVMHSGKGVTPDYPVCVMAEGTTFYHFKSLKSKVEYYVKQFLMEEQGRYLEFKGLDNATLIGAAIAGLTN